MSTITLEELRQDAGKWARVAAESGESVLVTQAGEPMVKITPALPPAQKTSRLPDREEEIRRMTPLPDSTPLIQEFRADRDL